MLSEFLCFLSFKVNACPNELAQVNSHLLEHVEVNLARFCYVLVFSLFVVHCSHRVRYPGELEDCGCVVLDDLLEGTLVFVAEHGEVEHELLELALVIRRQVKFVQVSWHFVEASPVELLEDSVRLKPSLFHFGTEALGQDLQTAFLVEAPFEALYGASDSREVPLEIKAHLVVWLEVSKLVGESTRHHQYVDNH